MAKLLLKYALVAILVAFIWYLGAFVAFQWVEFGTTDNRAGGPTACPMDAKICPDGTFVGRTGPHCEFGPCPTVKENAHTEVLFGEQTKAVVVLAEELSIPWGMAFLPDGDLFVSERPGTLVKIDSRTRERREIEVHGVTATGEGGLLGIALHPMFSKNHFVYMYLTTETPEGTTNKVVRYTYVKEGMLTNQTAIIEGIPGASYHDGGRIAFGPDGKLYITAGDAGEEDLAQDRASLAGKILRLNADGSIPKDNPFNTSIYSYGHRNPQGLTWDQEGELWSTEHGRSGFRSGLDELNLIQKGANYGWPNSQGNTVLEGTVGPVIHSGADVTWAPASAEYVDGSIFFTGLRGETLYEAVINANNEVTQFKEHLTGEYGRLRSVARGPDGLLYVTTSNTDGRGDPRRGDDKILRVDPRVL